MVRYSRSSLQDFIPKECARDLKMENVMMNSIQTQIKIVDFGLSNIYDPSSPLRTHCGSPEYAAPELFVPGKSYGPEVDLWSLGVILYGMVVGQLPFVTAREDGLSPQERRKRLLIQINKGYSAVQRKALSLASPEFRTMLAGMLVADAAKRITVNELLFHPWVTDKGKKSIILNPLRSLDEDWQISIMKQVATLLQLDWSTVRYAINNEPRGDVAGMYNILAYKLQAQKLEGDGVTKTLPSAQIPHYATPRSQLDNVSKETPAVSASKLKVKKRIERVKSPQVQKLQKISPEAAPYASPKKRALPTDKRPQTSTGTAGARKPKAYSRTESAQQKPKVKPGVLSTDARNRLHLAAENKHSVELRWNQTQTTPPSEGLHRAVSVPPPIPKPRVTLSTAPRPTAKPRICKLEASPKARSPRASSSKHFNNEMQIVGSKGIEKALLAMRKSSPGRIAKEPKTVTSPKSTQTTVPSAATDKIKSKSDYIGSGRRITTAPAAAAVTRIFRPVKRSRVIPVMGSLSVPTRATMASAPPAPQVRSRRATVSRPPSNFVEQSPQVQGDGHNKRASSTTPAKRIPIQRAILSDPIARSIADYIANNIPGKMDGPKRKKDRAKP